MNAAIVLCADRIPQFAEPGFKEFAPSLSGMAAAARQAGASGLTIWVLCASAEAADRCKEAVPGEAAKLRADVLFALCPGFFAQPASRPQKPRAAVFAFSRERPELVLFEDGIRSRNWPCALLLTRRPPA